MTSGFLDWWVWLVIGALILALLSIEYAHRRGAREPQTGVIVDRPPSSEGHDFSHWNGVDDFTLLEAASLWAEIDPPFATLDELQKNPKGKARYRMLTEAIEHFDLRAHHPFDPTQANTIKVPGTGQHAPEMLLYRRDLEELASAKGESPRFLFSDTGMPPPSEGVPRPDLKAVAGFNTILDRSEWAHKRSRDWTKLPAVPFAFEHGRSHRAVKEERLRHALDTEIHDLLAQGQLCAWGRAGASRVQVQIPAVEWQGIKIDFSERTLSAQSEDGGPPTTCAWTQAPNVLAKRIAYTDVRFSEAELLRAFPLRKR